MTLCRARSGSTFCYGIGLGGNCKILIKPVYLFAVRKDKVEGIIAVVLVGLAPYTHAT